MSNNIKTFVLIATLTALLLVIGQLAGGRAGLVIAILFALGINFISYWFSDKIVLKIYRANPMDIKEYPDVKNIVENLAVNANLPAPRIYIIPGKYAQCICYGQEPCECCCGIDKRYS